VPMIAGLREYVAGGGLMSYGASLSDSYRRAGRCRAGRLGGVRFVSLTAISPSRKEFNE